MTKIMKKTAKDPVGRKRLTRKKHAKTRKAPDKDVAQKYLHYIPEFEVRDKHGNVIATSIKVDSLMAVSFRGLKLCIESMESYGARSIITFEPIEPHTPGEITLFP